MVLSLSFNLTRLIFGEFMKKPVNLYFFFSFFKLFILSCLIFLFLSCTTQAVYSPVMNKQRNPGFVLQDSLDRRAHWDQSQSSNPALVELGLLSSAPVNLSNGSHPNTLEMREKEQGQRILKQIWGIENRFELLKSMDRRLLSGLGKYYRETLDLMNRSEDGTSIETDLEYLLDNIKYLSISVINSYELGRLSSLVRWGYNAGFLTQTEAEYVLEDIGLMIHYSDYDFEFLTHSQIMGMSLLNRSSEKKMSIMRDRALHCSELIDKGFWTEKNRQRLLSESQVYITNSDIELPSYYSEMKYLPAASRSKNLTKKEKKLFDQNHQPQSIYGIFSHEVKLYNAILNNDLKAVKDILDESMDHDLTFIDTPVRQNHSWISLAVGNSDILKLLDEYGFSTTIRHPVVRSTSLHRAVRKNSIESTVYLVLNGIDVNQQDIYGVTPLHIAAESGKVELVEKLITLGADPTIKSARGFTPLLDYLNNEYNKTFINIKNDDQSLYEYQGNFAPNLKSMNNILSVNRGIPGNEGRDPIWYLRHFGNQEQLQEELDYLKINFPEYRLREDRGFQLLYSLIKRNQRTVFEEAIPLISNINYRNDKGEHILSVAALNGHNHWAVVSLILGGADPDQPFGRNDENILENRVQYTNFFLIADMVENGATVNFESMKWSVPFFTKFLQIMSESNRSLDRLKELCIRMVKAGALLLPYDNFSPEYWQAPYYVLAHEKFDTFRIDVIKAAIERGEKFSSDSEKFLEQLNQGILPVVIPSSVIHFQKDNTEESLLYRSSDGKIQIIVERAQKAVRVGESILYRLRIEGIDVTDYKLFFIDDIRTDPIAKESRNPLALSNKNYMQNIVKQVEEDGTYSDYIEVDDYLLITNNESNYLCRITYTVSYITNN